MGDSLDPAGGSRPFVTATWRHLLMVSYAVDPAVLRPLVPAGTELDLWRGRALVSVVGFRFLETRVMGWRIPGHVNFDEVNLRFYVRRQYASGDVRRGVAFVKEIVPRQAIALIARWRYNEPYVALPMRHEVVMDAAVHGANGSVSYEWKFRNRWCRLAARTVGAPAIAQPDSVEAFITEHHWGYTAQRDGGCKEYFVEHPGWRLWETRGASVDGDMGAFYGPAFGEAMRGEIVSALVADGSAVSVFSGRPIARGR